MDPAYENKRRRFEAGYWLFRARRELIFAMIRRSGGGPRSKILDAGCGGGLLIGFMRKHGFVNISGIDTSQVMVELCRERGLMNVSRQDCTTTAFPGELFEIIIAADVLEHLKNDAAALREWNRILKKNGRLIITVPAFDFLWSPHDEVCHHYRRYSRPDLVHSLSEANFSIEKTSFWNCALFFPLTLIRILQKMFSRNRSGPSDQLYGLNPFINYLLLQLLRGESRILRWIDLPVGISILAIARKIN